MTFHKFPGVRKASSTFGARGRPAKSTEYLEAVVANHPIISSVAKALAWE